MKLTWLPLSSNIIESAILDHENHGTGFTTENGQTDILIRRRKIQAPTQKRPLCVVNPRTCKRDIKTLTKYAKTIATAFYIISFLWKATGSKLRYSFLKKKLKPN